MERYSQLDAETQRRQHHRFSHHRPIGSRARSHHDVPLPGPLPVFRHPPVVPQPVSLLVALLRRVSLIRRTKLWHNDLLAILGYIAATVYIPLYALHVRSPLSTTLNSADFGYMCIVLMAFVLFHEACGSRVIDYKGRMYRVEMVDVERMGRMADREDRDEVGFDEFWGVGQKETP